MHVLPAESKTPCRAGAGPQPTARIHSSPCCARIPGDREASLKLGCPCASECGPMIDLATALNRPDCDRCHGGRIRPVGIVDSNRLRLDCDDRECDWFDYAQLPDLTKQIIYLDTATVIDIAAALARADANSPWIALHAALRDAAAVQAICCAGSSILGEEAELGHNTREVIRLSRSYANPGVRHHLQVRQAQVMRALEAFLENESPTPPGPLPPEDAFSSQVHSWQPSLGVDAYIATPAGIVEHRRTGREPTRVQLETILNNYVDQDLSRAQILERERGGFGEGIISEGLRSITARRDPAIIPPETDPWIVIGIVSPNDFDQVVERVRRSEELDFVRAVELAKEFLRSEHVRRLPISHLSATLYAELAASMQGATPRALRPSDARDIDHIATYLPYVDVFIADRYFTDVCNRLGLGGPSSTRIRTLRPANIEDFVVEIEETVANAPQVELGRRIERLIDEGGARRQLE